MGKIKKAKVKYVNVVQDSRIIFASIRIQIYNKIFLDSPFFTVDWAKMSN